MFFKRRDRQSGHKQHEHISEQKYETVVHEGGLKFIVNLSDYVDTGLFLDHRITRSMVRDLARGKNFLNLFAYTGSFTVYAGGLAARRGRRQSIGRRPTWIGANGICCSTVSMLTRTSLYARAQSIFVYEHRREPTYDLASRRSTDVFQIASEPIVCGMFSEMAVPLLQQLLLLMKPGGVIYFSNNFSTV